MGFAHLAGFAQENIQDFYLRNRKASPLVKSSQDIG